MGEHSRIEWTDATFNPWIGCTRISPACDHCYAEAYAKRTGQGNLWQGKRRRTTPSNWASPRQWNNAGWWHCPDCGLRGSTRTMGDKHDGCQHANAVAARRRVFCASMADVFDNEVDPQWRHDLFSLIHQTPNLDWLLLTKRIGSASKLVDASIYEACPNIWLGATVANQEEADRDIPKLIETPAEKRFLSIEPMLSRIDLCEQLGMWWNQTMNCWEGTHRYINRDMWGKKRIDWVICGGESGHGARPMNPLWARSLREQCAGAQVPFLFKQWGEWLGGEVYSVGGSGGFARHQDGTDGVHGGKPDHWWHGDAFGGVISTRVGKKIAGRMLDGRTHDGFPS